MRLKPNRKMKKCGKKPCRKIPWKLTNNNLGNYKIEYIDNKKAAKSQIYDRFLLVSCLNLVFFVPTKSIKTMEYRKPNRIKIALVEQEKTAKWFAGQLGKDFAVISNGELIPFSLH